MMNQDRRYRLIIADDEETICDFLADFIEGEQADFQVAGKFDDGKKAWDYMRENPVDCVITDIRMPNMSGLELAQRIHEEKRKSKVLLLSGYSEFEYARKGIEYGVLDYLLKPIDYMKLLNKLAYVKTLLDESTQAQNQEELLEEPGTMGSTEVVIERARQFMEDHYGESISRDDVAAFCFLNPQYFGRFFKQKTGCSVNEYLNRVRMKKARELLGENMTLAAIAERTGFANERYFSRVFKLYCGCTPLEYRMKLLKGKK